MCSSVPERGLDMVEAFFEYRRVWLLLLRCFGAGASFNFEMKGFCFLEGEGIA